VHLIKKIQTTGFGLVTRVIGHLHIRRISASNYSAIANLHTLQITAANTKFSQACSVFSSRFLVTASNSGDTSASAPTSLLSGECAATELSKGRCLPSRCLETGLVYSLISHSFHSNDSTCHNIHGKAYIFTNCEYCLL
jgi:hypothetical protein